jgi:hypothetical protein
MCARNRFKAPALAFAILTTGLLVSACGGGSGGGGGGGSGGGGDDGGSGTESGSVDDETTCAWGETAWDECDWG